MHVHVDGFVPPHMSVCLSVSVPVSVFWREREEFGLSDFILIA